MINKTGMIPFPKLIVFNGELVYYKEVPQQLLMHKFGEAVGESEWRLQRMTRSDKYIVSVKYYDGTRRHFMTPINRFAVSKYQFMNDIYDKQFFIPLSHMVEIDKDGHPIKKHELGKSLFDFPMRTHATC